MLNNSNSNKNGSTSSLVLSSAQAMSSSAVTTSTTPEIDTLSIYKKAMNESSNLVDLERNFQQLLKKDKPGIDAQSSNAQLYEILNQRSKALGYQACMTPSDNAVSDEDLLEDTTIQEILNSINAAKQNENYVVADKEALKKHLTQIPSAFISAGLNPTDPKDKDKDKEAEHAKLREDLKTFKLTALEVDGKYTNEEKSFMVILNQQLRETTFESFIKSGEVQNLIELAKKYNQDSVLFQWGAAQFYYHPQKTKEEEDTIRYGEGYTVYDESATQLPGDHYSKIPQTNGSSLIFQLNIDFDHRFTLKEFKILCEYKIKTRFDCFYTLDSHIPTVTDNTAQRHLILMRGVDGFIEHGKTLREKLIAKGMKPEKVQIFGSDFFIKELNEKHKEHAQEKDFFGTYIKPEMVACNKKAALNLISNPFVKVIIFTDMCKRIHEYPTWFGQLAQEYSVDVIAWNIYDAPKNSQRSYYERHKRQMEQIQSTDEKIVSDTGLVINQIYGLEKMDQIVETCVKDNVPAINNNLNITHRMKKC